jgi:hypothetical protein
MSTKKQPESAVPEPSRFERFRRLVLGDRVFFESLRRISDRNAFVEAAIRLSEQENCPLSAEDMMHALQNAGQSPQNPEDPMSVTDLVGWTPIRFHWELGRASLDWCWLGDTPFTEPFFDQTIEKALLNPATRIFVRRTSIDVLAIPEWVCPPPGLGGFIFHMSRSGSTLVSQMLAVMPKNLVISEAGVLDGVLHAHLRTPRVSDNQRREWLRGLVTALAWSRPDTRRHLFIKFDSWHVLDLPLIRRAFPDVPWIFVYRHPHEVMASHARQDAGPMTVDGAARRARVLANFCQSALEQLDGGSRLIHYRGLPSAVWTDILPHFGLECSAADIEQMRLVAQFDAKNSSVKFRDDSDSKQRALSDEARVAVDRWVMPIYRQLELHRA